MSKTKKGLGSTTVRAKQVVGKLSKKDSSDPKFKVAKKTPKSPRMYKP